MLALVALDPLIVLRSTYCEAEAEAVPVALPLNSLTTLNLTWTRLLLGLKPL